MALTKEEKKARKAAKALEKKNKADELRIRLQREHLKREIASHILWEHSLEKALRHAMVKIKEPVYRQQVEVLWHTLDRARDKKDSLINYIMKLRELADHQYQRTIANFCQITDGIIGTFLSDLDDIAHKNKIKTEEILERGKEELNYYLDYHKRAETHLNLLLYTGHEEADTIAWNTRGENAVRRNEDRCAFEEIRETIKSVLEGTYSYTWEQYKATVKAYLTSTAENQKQVRILRQKENMMCDIIATQGKQIILGAKQIKRLRIELTAYETGEKHAIFRGRRDRYRAAFLQMKKCMNVALEMDKRQLLTLVKESDEAIDWFKAAKKKCEKILRLAALCKKHESLREKIIPFGLEKSYKSEDASDSRPSVSNDPFVQDILLSSYGLTKLWQRMFKVELVKKALVREKSKLERENINLERYLQIKAEIDIAPNASKCKCYPRVTKRSLPQACAVEGALETKKFIRKNMIKCSHISFR